MTTQASVPSTAPKKRKAGWKRYLLANEAVLLGILVLALIAFLMIMVPTARQPRTYFDLLREISPNLIAAIGVTLLMLAGEFDLSIGAMLALTGVVTVTIFNVTGNMWLGILAGLATGPIVGSINGYLVTRQRMPSLMTTLGMMFALRGLVYVYTKKTPIVDEQGFASFVELYQGNVGPIPIPALIALALIIVAYVVTTQTEFGRRIYAIGGNPTAARVSGIQVERIKFWLFIVCSTTAALAGLLIAAQTGSGYFDAGASGFELTVITAVVLGGVSMAGGEGGILGAALGVLLLGLTGKGLRLAGIYTTWQLILTGIMLMVAVYLHGLRKRLLPRD
jgi:ribose/xylose/arabinose/galactoside ABC-type transport system permease subunit